MKTPMNPSMLLNFLRVFARLRRRVAACGKVIPSSGRRVAALALVVLAWAGATSIASGQTFTTNGCLVMSCLANQTNTVCGGGSYQLLDAGASVSNRCAGIDVVSHFIQCEPLLPHSFGLGTHPITCRVLTTFDFRVMVECGFTVTVQSETPLAVLQCPTNQTIVVPCESNCLPATYELPTVTNGNLIECRPPSGECLPLGVNRVTCWATNGCAYYTSCAFDIRLTRQAPFEMQQCPTNRVLVIPCASNCVSVTYYLPEVTNGTLISCLPPSGTCFPIGINQIVCRATNDCGDRLACGFMIRVVSDSLVIQCPTNQNQLIVYIPCFNAPCGTINYPLPTVTGGTLIDCTPPPGTCFRPGFSTVTCRATNDCAELRECSFTVQVRRDPGDPGPRFQEPWFGGTFTNQCGSNCVPVFYRVPYPVNGALESCIPPPGTCLPVGTHPVGCRATNSCFYNSIYFEVRVVQGEIQPPTISCPTPFVVTNCSTNCMVVDYPMPTAPPGVGIRCDPPPGTCLPVGTRLVSCVASNACGFSVPCSFAVRVIRNTNAPILHVERRDDMYFLFWGNACPGQLQSAREPDGPWETVPDAVPGYRVTPTEHRRYFRVIVTE